MSKINNAIRAGQTVIELGQTANTFAGHANQFRAADKKEMGRQVGRHAFNEGAETGKTMGKTWLKTFEVMPRLVCRGLQFLFAIIACGFYGHRVDKAADGDYGFSPEWYFALTIAGLSAATSLVFVAVTPLGALPLIGSKLKLFKTYRAFAWDLILFITWLVVFGIFAGIFLGRDSDDKYKGASTGPMKTAVWIDLVNSILWLTSGVYGCIKTFLGDKADEMTDKVGQKLFTKKQKPAKEADYAESV
ncbi:uracil phosphoribosyltransferase [Fusarium longipes]|uniref:Uracil phosphoribosyltransferase n=1 Tax=Fusarium longipes TaxID=694270 RepID=A0A395SYU6_9HYPO|nr:uracil phosphoribosyltransferase [Fusarium longipes]